MVGQRLGGTLRFGWPLPSEANGSRSGLIASLPQGYDTVIGEAGATFSEGEKQQLTVARALLRNAPILILILDEPTSALDVETEAQVMDGIKRLTRSRTTFIIARRLLYNTQFYDAEEGRVVA